MAEKPFNTNHVLARLARAGKERPVSDEIASRLRERLAEVLGDYDNVLWLGSEALAEDFTPTGGPYDVVVVDGVLPVVNDVPVLLFRCLQVLRADGLILASTLGVESFKELRAAWAEVGEGQGHVIPLTDVREVGSLLQKLKIALPVVDRDVLTVTFKDFGALYAALRGHGVGNVHGQRQKGLTTPRRLRAMEAAYKRLFPRADGRVPVTLEIIYLHGFRPDASQPVAAKRGSGKVSLVRILGE